MRTWVVACLALTACLDDLHPEVGPPLRASCMDADSDPMHSVHFGVDILIPIFNGEGRCVNCHTPGGTTPLGLEASGLDLSTYQTLRAGGALSGPSILVPGMPCASVLVDKIGPSPESGARMPFDGPSYLTDAQIQLIADWIAEGAEDN